MRSPHHRREVALAPTAWIARLRIGEADVAVITESRGRSNEGSVFRWQPLSAMQRDGVRDELAFASAIHHLPLSGWRVAPSAASIFGFNVARFALANARLAGDTSSAALPCTAAVNAARSVGTPMM